MFIIYNIVSKSNSFCLKCKNVDIMGSRFYVSYIQIIFLINKKNESLFTLGHRNRRNRVSNTLAKKLKSSKYNTM